MNDTQKEKLKILFNTAYYVGREKIAFNKFQSLCHLQIRNGIDLGKQYDNAPACKEFITSIAASLNKTIKTDVSESRFISIIADGSTDKSIIEQEGVYVRFVKAGKPVTRFVQLVNVSSSDAKGVYAGIKKAMQSIDVSEDKLKEKLVCINLDGASVNMGKWGGVQALAKKDFPHILAIHCVNHNLELAILDMKNSEDYMSKFESTLKEMFKLFN